MESIFALAVVGFVCLSVYNYRTQRMYTNNFDGYHFLMLALWWGVVSMSLWHGVWWILSEIYSIIYQGRSATDGSVYRTWALWPYKQSFGMRVGIHAGVAVMVGYFFSSQCIQKIIELAKRLVTNNNTPSFNGVSDRELHRIIDGRLP